MRKTLLSLLFLLSCLAARPAQDDFGKIRKRLYEITLYHTPRPACSPEEIIAAFDPQRGLFTDLDYTNQDRALWHPGIHWRRLTELACQYRLPGSPHYRSPRLREYILKGIDYWLAHTVECVNRWWNYMGVPYEMGKVFILMRDELPEGLIASCKERMLPGVRPDAYYFHTKATGQNLLWLTTIHIYASALTDDDAGLERAYRTAAGEIVVTTGEGIQPDFSFHQHDAQSYAFGYGKQFSLSAAQIVYSASGTRYALPEEKIRILSRYLLDGQQWCTRGRLLEYTAMGREISRREEKTGALVTACRLMRKADPSRAAEYDRFIAQLETGHRSRPLTGNRYFPRIDLMVQHSPGFFFSIKGVSDRIAATESGNRENLKGYYLSKGTQFISRRGDEYEGIFPLWDWEMLPGSLNTHSGNPLPVFKWRIGTWGNTPFVYGVSDSLRGCFAFDYRMDSVTARRGWFLWEDGVACLVSGLDFETVHPVLQTLNQCYARGPVLTDGRPMPDTDARGRYRTVWHDSVTYCLPGDREALVFAGRRSGTWYDINRSMPQDTVSARLFSLALDLGRTSRDGSFHCLILPGTGPGEATPARIGRFRVLRNDRDVQAVWNRSCDQVQIVAYRPARIALPWNGRSVRLTAPALLLVGREGRTLRITRFDPSTNRRLTETYPLNRDLAF